MDLFRSAEKVCGNTYLLTGMDSIADSIRISMIASFKDCINMSRFSSNPPVVSDSVSCVHVLSSDLTTPYISEPFSSQPSKSNSLR